MFDALVVVGSLVDITLGQMDVSIARLEAAVNCLLYSWSKPLDLCFTEAVVLSYFLSLRGCWRPCPQGNLNSSTYCSLGSDQKSD